MVARGAIGGRLLTTGWRLTDDNLVVDGVLPLGVMVVVRWLDGHRGGVVVNWWLGSGW